VRFVSRPTALASIVIMFTPDNPLGFVEALWKQEASKRCENLASTESLYRPREVN
jgi:hypothetical protein